MMGSRKEKLGTMRVVSLALLALGLCAAMLLSGCMTKAEKQFTIADVRVIGLYVAKAQPAVEAYCDTLGESGQPGAQGQAAQIRLDTQILAGEINANAAARLDKLRADAQAIAAARQAVNLAAAVLDSLAAEAQDPAPDPGRPQGTSEGGDAK